MKRLFVGIELPEEIRTAIATYLAGLPRPKKGWEQISDLHLTLTFIGQSSEEEYREIELLLNEIHFSPFEIIINEIDFFNRRIMFLKVQKTFELNQLKNQLNILLSGKFPPENKPFVPHITIKRWQRYEFDELKVMITKNPFLPLSFNVSTIALFQSSIDEYGQKYHVLSRYS